jgi:hypothetical protein
MMESGLLRVFSLLRLMLGVAVFVCSASAFCETFIVKDGQPQAEIVISENAPRTAKLAAEELQTYIEKISGAKLPITNAPGKDVPVQIYVGKSAHTDQLKINDEGLKSGAFRMVSGENHLVLLGHDSDFKTKGPFHSGGAIDKDSTAPIEWDKLTGKRWGFPTGMLAREYNKELNTWEESERGSFNAVSEFLRMQGVRWYMPGELGEIVPKKTTMTIPKMDKTVHPDFRLRYPYQYGHMFGHTTRDEVMWQLRLGIYNGPDPIVGGSHGQRNVLCRDEMKKRHPDFYALFNGKRETASRLACLSSEGMVQETADYARAMFDIYDASIVSVMPEDGYVNLCQCDLCKGKDTPERGITGQISDYVWDFVNRVAKEVYKTHPDRKVCCFAYGAYLLPPEKIDKLNPNVVVGICQWRSDFQDPKVREGFVKLREDWLKKIPASSRLMIADYYLHGRPNLMWDGIPVFFPRLIAQDLRSLKGISIGDFIEVYRDPGESLSSLSILHLNLYVTSRFWWNADQDLGAMLDEYYTLFYGPARGDMKAFIEYSEANWSSMGKSAEKIAKVFELLEKAQQKVPADSVYGKRITLIAEFIKPMKALQEQLSRGEGRENAPSVLGYSHPKKDLRMMDGKLDDPFWEGLRLYTLVERETGRDPLTTTSFRISWADDAIYIGIRCDDIDTKKLNIQSTENEDPAILNGDCVEILIETQSHSYYQFAVNPAGAIIDLDRKQDSNSKWASNAQAASYIGDGFWSVEIRIPVLGEQQEFIDPLNGLAGRKPTGTYPWYFNLCRQRVRSNGTEFSSFSPTGEASFYVPAKFGKLVTR